MKKIHRRFIGPIFATILCLQACGGSGGNESSMNSTPVANNRAPNIALSATEINVSEAQPFRLDATNSSDPDGDSLRISWEQIAGTPIQIDNPNLLQQDLIAPDIAVNEAMEFEVSVSDATQTSQSRVTVNVQNLEKIRMDSAPSIFNDNEPLEFLSGIVPDDSNGYSLYWLNINAVGAQPTSSQMISPSDEKIGAQIDGEFDDPNIEFARTISVLNTDNTPTYLTVGFTSPEFGLSYFLREGLVSGTLNNYGNEITNISLENPGSTTRLDIDPISESRVALTLSTDLGNGLFEIATTIAQTTGESFTTIVSTRSEAEKLYGQAREFGNQNIGVVWAESRQAEAGTDIILQQIDSNGDLLGLPTTLYGENEDGGLSNVKSSPLSNGGLFVSWREGVIRNQMPVQLIRGVFLDQDGTIASSVFEVFDNNDPTRLFSILDITPLSDNFAMVVLNETSAGSDFSSQNIFCIIINENGEVISEPIRFDTSPTQDGERRFVSLVNFASLSNGRLILGWTEGKSLALGNEGPLSETFIAGFFPIATSVEN